MKKSETWRGQDRRRRELGIRNEELGITSCKTDNSSGGFAVSGLTRGKTLQRVITRTRKIRVNPCFPCLNNTISRNNSQVHAVLCRFGNWGIGIVVPLQCQNLRESTIKTGPIPPRLLRRMTRRRRAVLHEVRPYRGGRLRYNNKVLS